MFYEEDSYPSDPPHAGEGEHPKNWVLLAAAILPAVLPVVFQKIGDEISEFFRRRRIAKRKAKLEALKAARKAAKLQQQHDSETPASPEEVSSNDSSTDL